jgi:hypothetical protein
MNGLATEEGAGVQPFRKLGELLLGNFCSWVSREMAANMLNPLMKHSTGNDARPVSAKDCDYAIWMKSIHRTLVEVVSKNALPQQLGIYIPAGNEAKNEVLRMCKEERLASGRGGVVVKDDRINAHNTFCNKAQSSKRVKCTMQPSSPACLISKPGRTRRSSPGLGRIRTEHVSFAR